MTFHTQRDEKIEKELFAGLFSQVTTAFDCNLSLLVFLVLEFIVYRIVCKCQFENDILEVHVEGVERTLFFFFSMTVYVSNYPIWSFTNMIS